MLIFHIITSFLSIFAITLGLIYPSKGKYYLGLLLNASSLTSGLLLILNTNVSLGKACFAGIFYLITTLLLIKDRKVLIAYGS